ncbi:MAG: helix-turn-helix transcriptional regulator [Chloroflexi bacterium]|nr:helix-turn-helix transcriptional regulator [Chloroflexota bacterium]MYC02753.1 helix-turn-helix transcriptional regulator [Chloroflexota bacterium]
MIDARAYDYRSTGAQFPDDFPQRLERLRAASGLTWRRLARELGVGVRSLYRWRAGTRPDAAHMLAIVEFATELELLDCLLSGTDEREADERQARLFREDVWAGLCGGGEASDGAQDTRRAA